MPHSAWEQQEHTDAWCSGGEHAYGGSPGRRGFTSWMATLSPSFILSNSSMQTMPRSASTMAPASSRFSPARVQLPSLTVLSLDPQLETAASYIHTLRQPLPRSLA